jgi:metal-dependent amidase/aminoacylase/carboxypeptidase family protein
VSVRKVGEDYADLLSNSPLASAYGSNLARVGRTVMPEVPSMNTGSTDMGNVSKLVPTVHPMIAVSPPNVALHSREFTKWAGSEAGHRAIVDGAKALAMTALDVLRDGDLRAAMKASFDAALGATR